MVIVVCKKTHLNPVFTGLPKASDSSHSQCGLGKGNPGDTADILLQGGRGKDAGSSCPSRADQQSTQFLAPFGMFHFDMLAACQCIGQLLLLSFPSLNSFVDDLMHSYLWESKLTAIDQIGVWRISHDSLGNRSSHIFSDSSLLFGKCWSVIK